MVSAPWFDANGLSDVPSIDKQTAIQSFKVSSTVFKAVRIDIKANHNSLFQSLLFSWTMKGQNILISYSIFYFSHTLYPV